MKELDTSLVEGLHILFNEWGMQCASYWPVLPTQGLVYKPPADQVAQKMIRTIGITEYQRLITYILKLSSRDDHKKLIKSLGSPSEDFCFFYLTAAYNLLAASWKTIESIELGEILIQNLFLFGLPWRAVYLLQVLCIPIEEVIRVWGKLINHEKWIIRENAVGFVYELFYPQNGGDLFTVSNSQWQQFYDTLQERSAIETEPEIRHLLKRITLIVQRRLNSDAPPDRAG